MSRNRIITYAVEKDTGIVLSRVDSEICCPVLDFFAIGQGGHGFVKGDFNGPMIYKLEKMPVMGLAGQWQNYRWTKKIPLRLKNRHRKFWGMKPLKKA